MESNHCICINHILRQFVNALRTIGQTQLSLQSHRNLPATDEGYVNSNINLPQNTGMNFLTFDNLMIIALLGCLLGYLVTSGRKKQSKLN
jgi:hypothetical protein